MELRIASRCPLRWDDLQGDDRVRYCDRCRLNVYNFAAMEPDERDRLVAQVEGRLCGRLLVRSDGLATVRECEYQKHRRWLRRAAVFAAVLATALSIPPFLKELDRKHILPNSVVRVLERVGILERETMGVMAR